jgi:hypothetical protein
MATLFCCLHSMLGGDPSRLNLKFRWSNQDSVFQDGAYIKAGKYLPSLNLTVSRTLRLRDSLISPCVSLSPALQASRICLAGVRRTTSTPSPLTAKVQRTSRQHLYRLSRMQLSSSHSRLSSLVATEQSPSVCSSPQSCRTPSRH